MVIDRNQHPRCSGSNMSDNNPTSSTLGKHFYITEDTEVTGIFYTFLLGKSNTQTHADAWTNAPEGVAVTWILRLALSAAYHSSAWTGIIISMREAHVSSSVSICWFSVSWLGSFGVNIDKYIITYWSNDNLSNVRVYAAEDTDTTYIIDSDLDCLHVPVIYLLE